LTHPGPRFAGHPFTVQILTPPTYWRCEPDWAWQARPLPDYLLWFVLDGIGQLDVGGQQYELAIT
jgi:AraC family transcriptional regulator, arabinose operon regulatory protein